ncbi:putative RDD family membrane protein YckC [Bacillus sp. SLBN-46]|uniref:RDD family protein n=1 Tax=Bacillus sp. SLBN-46 TaxID=3042283 RepID=UPI00285FD187|nr:RDD family protein [Bacillus sp. SLBN-46]MDR6125044.1 putative RDD family membrane protein YckC [Bacillus sp. SLBN-46]
MEPSEGNAWFYIRDHQQQGPVGIFELKKLLEQGILTAETFIWTKELEGWQRVKSLNLLPDTILKSGEKDESPINLASEWEEIKKETYPNGRPVVRYLARFFDLSLFSLFLITLVSVFSPRFIVESSGIAIFMFSLVLYILVEASILSIFGNTLGKTILNARLRMVNGEHIDFFTALKRSIFVTAAGMGFGIPLINFICFYFSYSDLKKNGRSTWDNQIGTVVLYGKVSFARIVFVSLFPISLLVAGLII